MTFLLKFLCLECRGRFFVIDIEDMPHILEDIALGDALPMVCPLCQQRIHAVLQKKIPMFAETLN